MSEQFAIETAKYINKNYAKSNAIQESKNFIKNLAKQRRYYLLKYSIITGIISFYLEWINLDNYGTGSWIFSVLSFFMFFVFIIIFGSFLTSWKDEKNILLFAEMFLSNPQHFYHGYSQYFNPNEIWGFTLKIKK
jgi:hypothetical protein